MHNKTNWACQSGCRDRDVVPGADCPQMNISGPLENHLESWFTPVCYLPDFHCHCNVWIRSTGNSLCDEFFDTVDVERVVRGGTVATHGCIGMYSGDSMPKYIVMSMG